MAAMYLAPVAISMGSVIGHAVHHLAQEATVHARWAGTHDIGAAARALVASREAARVETPDGSRVHTHGPGAAPHSHSLLVDALLTAANGDEDELTAAPVAPTLASSHVPPSIARWEVVPAWSAAAGRPHDPPPAAWPIPPPSPPPRV